jgi:hypothetical protein
MVFADGVSSHLDRLSAEDQHILALEHGAVAGTGARW